MHTKYVLKLSLKAIDSFDDDVKTLSGLFFTDH